ncbi:MAG: BtaA family protein [marine benthic group bacterium]|nr:BtaA family protein [Gemmatimonadota bacterium]
MSDRRFYSRLNYSSINEDWRTEIEGLQPRSGQRVLCITGSGARPLDILAAEPVRMVAIDLAPPQNHLLRLKIAALSYLPFDSYLRFLGVRESTSAERREVWKNLRGSLPENSRLWWESHPRMLDRGVLYAGAFERHLHRFSRAIRILRPVARSRLLEASDPEQLARAASAWDCGRWRTFLRIGFSPLTSRILLGDPAYYRRPAVAPGPTIHSRMVEALHRWPASSSFMLGLILTGRLPHRDLPPHLTEEGVERIRNRIEGLEIVDLDLREYLLEDCGRFDAFSLSDLTSYLDEDGLRHLLDLVANRSESGARLVIRQFLTRDPWPPGLEERFVRLHDIEHRLRELDQAFAYEFFVAEAAS